MYSIYIVYFSLPFPMIFLEICNLNIAIIILYNEVTFSVFSY